MSLVAAGMWQPTIWSIPGLHRFHGLHCLPYKFWTEIWPPHRPNGPHDTAQVHFGSILTNSCYSNFGNDLCPKWLNHLQGLHCLHCGSFLVVGLLHRLPGKCSETWLSQSMQEPATHLMKRTDVQTSLGESTTGVRSSGQQEQNNPLHAQLWRSLQGERMLNPARTRWPSWLS